MEKILFGLLILLVLTFGCVENPKPESINNTSDTNSVIVGNNMNTLSVLALENDFNSFLVNLEKNQTNLDFIRKMVSKYNVPDKEKEAQREIRGLKYIFDNKDPARFPKNLKCDQNSQTCLARFDIGDGDSVFYKFKRESDGFWYKIDYADNEREVFN